MKIIIMDKKSMELNKDLIVIIIKDSINIVKYEENWLNNL